MSIKPIIGILFIILTVFIIGYVLVKAYPDFETPYSHIQNKKPIKVSLEYWGLWDNSDDWQEIISKYKNKTLQLNGRDINISVNYSKKDYNSYRSEINKSKTKKNGPNIFMINNNWFANYFDQIQPLNNNNAIATEYNLLHYDDISAIYPRNAIAPVIHNKLVYSIPLYSDSLALFYNKNILKKALIESPPKNWQEFKKDVKRLTVLDNYDNITQAGISLGTGSNISRSSDIISLLMMQSGGQIINPQGDIDIAKDIEIKTIDGSENRTPGKIAIEFYTEFSNPKKDIYTWDNKQLNSVENFANGKSAMMIGYNYHIGALRALNPDLNYGISQMPQLENSTKINFSNVWLPVVSKSNNCKVEPIEFVSEIDCAKLSWNFLSFASQKDNSQLYLDSTGKVAVRKDLIAQQINENNNLSAFASQVESSTSYNKFSDQIDNILVEMLDQINLNRKKFEEIINDTVEKIEELKKS